MVICDVRIQPNHAREGQGWVAVFDTMDLRVSSKVPCQSRPEKDNETPAMPENEADPRQGCRCTDVKVYQVQGE